MGFNRHTKTGVITTQTVVTCPPATVITVIGATVANTTGNFTTISIKAAGVYVLKDAPIAPGSAIVPIGGEQKIVLLEGDTLTVTANFAVDVIVSTLEQVI